MEDIVITMKLIVGEIKTVRTRITQMKIKIEVLKVEIDKASQRRILLEHQTNVSFLRNRYTRPKLRYITKMIERKNWRRLCT